MNNNNNHFSSPKGHRPNTNNPELLPSRTINSHEFVITNNPCFIFLPNGQRIMNVTQIGGSESSGFGSSPDVFGVNMQSSPPNMNCQDHSNHTVHSELITPVVNITPVQQNVQSFSPQALFQPPNSNIDFNWGYYSDPTANQNQSQQFWGNDGQFTTSNLSFNGNYITHDNFFVNENLMAGSNYALPNFTEMNQVGTSPNTAFFTLPHDNSLHVTTQQENPNLNNNQYIDQTMAPVFMQSIPNTGQSHIFQPSLILQNDTSTCQGITTEQVNGQQMNGSITNQGFLMNNQSQNVNYVNVNNQNNQSVVFQLVHNGQVQYASIDPSLLHPIMLNPTNTQATTAFFTSIGDITQQIATQHDGQNVVVQQENSGNSVIQKIVEPLDLMENPANWRRVPNNGGYQCNLCNKCYTRKYGLKIHLRIHSGFKPLECKVCKKKFGDPSNMAKHIRLHSSEGSPYKCNLCNKPLVRRRDLERHMRSRHPDYHPQGSEETGCCKNPHNHNGPRDPGGPGDPGASAGGRGGSMVPV